MRILGYGNVTDDKVREILKKMKQRTGAADLKDAIQLSYHDLDFYSQNRHDLKLIKMLYSASMDAASSINVISLYSLYSTAEDI